KGQAETKTPRGGETPAAFERLPPAVDSPRTPKSKTDSLGRHRNGTLSAQRSASAAVPSTVGDTTGRPYRGPLKAVVRPHGGLQVRSLERLHRMDRKESYGRQRTGCSCS